MVEKVYDSKTLFEQKHVSLFYAFLLLFLKYCCMQTVSTVVREIKPLLNMDNSLSSDMGMLSEYEQEYEETSASIHRALISLKEANASEIPSIIENIKQEICQCRMCVKNMKHECRSMSAEEQRKWNPKISAYEQSFRQISQDFQKEKSNANRNELFLGAKDMANVMYLCLLSFLFI